MILEGKSEAWLVRALTAGIIITGGLSIIGTAVGELVVSKGGYVVAVDMAERAEGDEKLSARKQPERWFYQKADITDKHSMQAAIDAAMQEIPKGSLAGAVHCAATNPHKPWTGRMSDKIDDFETCLRVNALGTFIVDSLVADAINSQYLPLDPFHERVEEERGAIVNLASVVAYDTPARCLTYGPSKTAVLGITNAAADFLAPSGIRVNDVSPAIVHSPMAMNGGRHKYFVEELEAQSMFPRRFTQPHEIAEAIVFLLEHPMMNSFHLKVDAGWRQISDWAGGQDPRRRHPMVE